MVMLEVDSSLELKLSTVTLVVHCVADERQ